MMEGILQSIEDGEVALMQAPPEKPIVTQQKDERATWASQYVNFFPPTKKQALQTGIMAFVQNPGLGRSKDVIEKVIVKDLSMMQRHPALMTSYRRFVVINLEAEGSRCGEFYEGVSVHFFVHKTTVHSNFILSSNGRQQASSTLGMTFTRSRRSACINPQDGSNLYNNHGI